MNYSYFQDYSFKRVKERSVGDAYERVKLWRQVFEEGIILENGEFKKLTLKQAAELVGIPKKTLEDYTQIFSKVRLIANIESFAEKKMGYLRAFIKKNKTKLKKAVFNEKIKKIEQKEFKYIQLEEEQKEEQKEENIQNQIEEFHTSEYTSMESYRNDELLFDKQEFYDETDQDAFEDSCILFPPLHPRHFE